MEPKKSTIDAEQLLTRILHADEEARQATMDAQAERTAASERIASEKAELRKTYESETEAMLERVRDSARKAAQSRFSQIADEQNQKLARLNTLAEARTAAWVEQICAAILRGAV